VAGRLTATGILLVGGASERFGSPKALASFRGETLGERGWRILHEAFDEVVAVGKEADGLELPFPVLDDGAEERAPVFGIIAGLRAASNDMSCVLPTDCPLVTHELLHELAEACAVAPTGPLPGAYPKELLPELEARVARGELSLRGVNPNVLEVDEKLLLNVNTRMDLIQAAIADWAREREDVRAALVAGSQVRADTPADRWSDLDVVLFVDDPARLADDATWVAEFGVPTLNFLEATAFGNEIERRVLYDTGEDVDFPLLEASAWRELIADPDAQVLLARGYRVLHDDVGMEDELEAISAPPTPALPDEVAFRELANDFWYHALWTAKKLRRGEVYTALLCLDGYLKVRLVVLLGWHARAVDPSVDTWHGGRFLERWADPGALAALELAYAHYDVRDVARALWATIDLWQALEEETARRLGVEVGLDHPDLRRRIAEVVPQPAASHRLSS
jgi:molybdopterin-guanine dinucleotide biosynthesis protein A